MPLKIRKAVTLINADYYRRNHHKRSKNIILGLDKEFYDYIENFNLNDIPNRFKTILAEIAYGHGISFYDAIDRLEHSADGYSSDRMHPRFVSCLLRLGDLLDVDDKRFNIFSEKVFSNELPSLSKHHKDKHASIRHLLISSNSIEITVDCNDDETYRTAHQWFGWLQDEVQDQSREWSNIAPSNLLGYPPRISRGKIKILYQSADPKEELRNLKFSISNERIFNILEGASLYEDTSFVFFREVIQNAIDASKIQLWKLIQSEVYDYNLKKFHNSSAISHHDLIQMIKFPVDLPEDIWYNTNIVLDINWSESNPDYLRICIRDKGTGISEKDLVRMTQKVGESRQNDIEYKKFKESMPYWMRPTGAFGIGLQSIFLIVDNFTVHTKSDAEEAKEIIFYSAKKGEYSRITNNKPNISRGTEVSIEIHKDRIVDLFTHNVGFEITNSFDVFTDGEFDVQFNNMRSYLMKELAYIKMLEINFMGKIIKELAYGDKKISNTVKDEKNIVRDKHMLTTVYKDEYFDNRNVYLSYEDMGIGSTVTIEFYRELDGSFQNTNVPYYINNGYILRDMRISEKFPNYLYLNYCRLAWNFQSPDSDKILNLSREKLITKVRIEYINQLFNEILPKIVQQISFIFNNIVDNNVEKYANEYFNMELTARMLNINTGNLLSKFKNVLVPELLATGLNLRKINYEEFFKSNKIIFVNKIYKDDVEENDKERLSIVFSRFQLANAYDAQIVIWGLSYLRDYVLLSKFYIVEELVYKEDNGDVIITILSKHEGYESVNYNENAFKRFLRTLDDENPYYGINNRRRFLIPVSKYSMLAVKVRYDRYNSDIDFNNHYIISPFTRNYFSVIKREVLERDLQNDRYQIKDYINNYYLEKLVPDSLVDFVIKNASMSGSEVMTKEIVIQNYLSLIVDAIEEIIENPVDE